MATRIHRDEFARRVKEMQTVLASMSDEKLHVVCPVCLNITLLTPEQARSRTATRDPYHCWCDYDSGEIDY